MFWYEDEIKQLENKPVVPGFKKKRVIFYGSSSIRFWESLETDFPEFDAMNLGFGGSTFAACCWFFKRVVPQHKPDIIVIYAGDNDLGDGRHPEEVYLYFKNMMALIKEYCGQIPVFMISVKASPARLNLYNSIEYTNKIISAEILQKYPSCTFVDVFNEMLINGEIDQTLYEPDGLHLSSRGYEVWTRILKTHFQNQLE
jgi:lysophospholipase L1-like esterase